MGPDFGVLQGEVSPRGGVVIGLDYLLALSVRGIGVGRRERGARLQLIWARVDVEVFVLLATFVEHHV